ncbi:DNA mismatch repair protein Msh4 [Paraphysoderma sedebokerense]|nr:DNA mismatch repair protein Msh4 [Paraphysoderma sedebokerense]
MPSKTLSQISQLSLQSRSARQRLASSSSRPSTALSTAPSSVNSTHSVSSVSLSRPLTARSIASRPGTARSARTRTPTAVNTTVLHGQYIVALYESKSLSNEVGLCAVDLTTSECILCQFMDSRTYSKCLFKLGIYQPVEILIPIHSIEPTKSKLCVLLEDHFSEVAITPIARKYFNDKTGMSLIQKYGLEEYVTSLQLALESKYLCLATAAAALKYIEATESISFSARSMRFRYQTIEGSMMMDTATAKNLELVSNLSNPKSKGSLFGVLNETKTKMGLRMLRTNILQPSVDEGTLNTRLDAVAELLSNDELRSSIQSAIKDITDLDVIISNIIQIKQKNSLKNPEQNINNVIYVKHTLELIKVLRVSLNSVRSELLKAVRKILHDPSLDYITTQIDHVINPDITLQKSPLGLRNQRCYAVKSGFNGLLDVARQTYKETTNDIYELVNTYKEEYGLNIKLVFKQSQGFVMNTSTENVNRRGGHQNRRHTENAETQDEDCQIDESEINGVNESRCGEKRLPLIFCNVVKKGKNLWFSSLDLMKYNDRLNESLMEVFLMSDRTISDLITKFRSKIGSLYKVSESLAMLDMLSSFATSAKANRYVRPEFSDTLAIKAGRHPIREKLASEGITGGTGKFVPNDTYANNSTSFQVITGPNMSGKSTYLRQIALLCVMGQIGSFVPASYASLRITNHLFTRLSLDDSQETNASTFMLEMREIGYILQSITPSHSSSSSSDAAGGSEVMCVSEGGKSNGCLVLIDELGRGTSTYDGVGIAWAVCEELRNGKAFVFFATHFQELPVALEIFPNVVNLHLEVQVDTSESKLRYLYTLRDGRCEEEHYGLRLARSIKLPGGVIETAEEIAGWLTQKINEQKAKSVASRKVKLQKLFLQA